MDNLIGHGRDSESGLPPRSSVWPMVGVIWAVAAFVAGALVSFGVGYGRGNSSIDNLVLSVSRLEGSVTALDKQVSYNDKANTQELQKIEDHLNYDDDRLNRLETSNPNGKH